MKTKFKEHLRDIGTEVSKIGKQGGGSYIIVGHINCPRQSCQKLIELREQQEPSKAQIKNGYYWIEWSICPFCGLYSHGSKKETVKQEYLEMKNVVEVKVKKKRFVKFLKREDMIRKVGFLRQWLNEKPEDRLVTDADIINWLKLDKLKK